MPDADALIANLRQTAHKDVVDGVLSDYKSELPKQMVMALSNPAMFYTWLDDSGRGCLHARREARKEEKMAMREATFVPGAGIIFHAFQTHAGGGENSNLWERCKLRRGISSSLITNPIMSLRINIIMESTW